jgi:hypothetical protein
MTVFKEQDRMSQKQDSVWGSGDWAPTGGQFQGGGPEKAQLPSRAEGGSRLQSLLWHVPTTEDSHRTVKSPQ